MRHALAHISQPRLVPVIAHPRRFFAANCRKSRHPETVTRAKAGACPGRHLTRHHPIHHTRNILAEIYPHPAARPPYLSHPARSGAARRRRPRTGAGCGSRARQRRHAFKVTPCRPAEVKALGCRTLMGRVSAKNPARGGHRPHINNKSEADVARPVSLHAGACPYRRKPCDAAKIR
jgi:hypothetical protein